jgi:hypothetical protein
MDAAGVFSYHPSITDEAVRTWKKDQWRFKHKNGRSSKKEECHGSKTGKEHTGNEKQARNW